MRRIGYSHYVAHGGDWGSAVTVQLRAQRPAELIGIHLNMLSLLPADLPVGASLFPNEIIAAPRSWADRVFPNIVHWNKLPCGGHFAAFEQPVLFVEELRSCFRKMR